MVTDSKEIPDCCISWIKETCFPLGMVTSPGWYLPTLGQCPWALSGVCWCGTSRWSRSRSWSTCLPYPGWFYEFCRNSYPWYTCPATQVCWVQSYCRVGIVLCPGKPGEMRGRGRALAGFRNVRSTLQKVLAVSSREKLWCYVVLSGGWWRVGRRRAAGLLRGHKHGLCGGRDAAQGFSRSISPRGRGDAGRAVAEAAGANGDSWEMVRGVNSFLLLGITLLVLVCTFPGLKTATGSRRGPSSDCSPRLWGHL